MFPPWEKDWNLIPVGLDLISELLWKTALFYAGSTSIALEK
jgi:hypothetical protein